MRPAGGRLPLDRVELRLGDPSRFEDRFCAERVSGVDRSVEGGIDLLCSLCDEEPNHVDAATANRPDERRGVVEAVATIDVGPFPDQDLDHAEVTVLGRQHERRDPGVVRQIDVAQLLAEDEGRLRVPLGCGVAQLPGEGIGLDR